MITRKELESFYNDLLKPGGFSDYCPNGLQVEGTKSIGKIAFAVSATADSVARAATASADALVVHHGLFWKFHGVKTLTGAFARRIFPLVRNDINLFGYHLPLDAHPEIGNAASLGRQIGLEHQQPFGDYQGCPTGVRGVLKSPFRASDLREKLKAVLDHPVILATPDESAVVATLGIITGGANGDWQLAAREGLNAYLTGEISEHDWHESREAGVHMFAGGHHATERFGIKALMDKTRDQFDIECFFIGSDNPA
ncbi:MAG: Nif3-like dinuclear metal center hexameric protein [Gammaproteobacteria bacterium]